MTVPRHLTHSPFWTHQQREAHRIANAYVYTLMPSEEELEKLPALAQAVRNFEPCRYRVTPLHTPGTPCAGCGHTDLVHPGVHQLASPPCGGCMLLITWLEMKGA